MANIDHFLSSYISHRDEKKSPIFYIVVFPIFQCKSDIGAKKLHIGPEKYNYIRIIGGFFSYIGFIGNIGALSGLRLATFTLECGISS